MNQPQRSRAPIANIRNVLGYAAMRAGHVFRGGPSEEESQINQSLVGYPHNHIYRLCQGHTLPGFQLYERLQAVARLYPTNMATFLDLGCCRGGFVLDAARQPGCRLAAGVDLHEPFISAANRAAACLKVENAKCHLATLMDVAEAPQAFGGPFEVVLTLGTYHYLYWGSERYATPFHGHREILASIARVCADRLIFSARMEIDRLPHALEATAMASDNATCYTRASFLEAADEFFDVELAGYLGKDPLFLMSKKHPAEGRR